MRHLRPLLQTGPARPDGAVPFGALWFTHVEVLGENPRVLPVSDLLAGALDRFGTRAQVPEIMGILNVTPDSFSDGGQHNSVSRAVEHALAMISAGAGVIDVGGESTRPGALEVEISEEIQRTAPVIAALRAAGVTAPISIDTRKAPVAEAAIKAGATMVNDVSGFTFDPNLAPLCAASDVHICVMHSIGLPQDMQNNPTYSDVLTETFDFLHSRISALVDIGIATDKIIADPGIGFGKTQAHNLALLERISLFHALGVPILLGASRKRFIGTIGNAPEAADRAPGSIAVALAAMAQGVQMVRVHDVADHAQAIALWRASVAHPQT
ncbi:MAG: dihydropteroate synthase [Pseudomonadota bacterium]